MKISFNEQTYETAEEILQYLQEGDYCLEITAFDDTQACEIIKVDTGFIRVAIRNATNPDLEGTWCDFPFEDIEEVKVL